jgi:predicted dehydrogenase
MSTSSKKRIRIGFIGVGGMGQAAHLRNYASLAEECEVVALAELRPEMGAKVAARYGIPKIYRNHEELLAKEKVDALVASQQFTRHGVVIPELARAGVPILSEKPIAGSIAVAEKIVKALEENKTWLMVGYHKRSDPATIYAKNEIDRLKESGELGKFRYLRITMPPGDWIAGGFNDNIGTAEQVASLDWDPAPEDMDEVTNREYIAFVNFYIHQVNLLRHLFGEDYRVTYADPSAVLFVAQSESGIPGVIEMAPYSTTVGWHEAALAAFEKGYVKLQLPAPLVYNQSGRVEIFKDPGQGVAPVSLVPDLPPIHAMRNQALNFIKAVRGEASAPCLAPEALQDLRVAREYIRLWKGV